MLKPGDKAPDFTLSDQDGNEMTMSKLLAGGPLLLYFYPADFTPGCTKEACDIRDMHDDISDVGIKVVGISPQDGESHNRFRLKHQLPFTLLADTDKVAIKAYGVDGPMGIGVRRATFLIDEDGRIENVVLADLRIGKHGDFIRHAVSQRRDQGT
jgi:peroxiredoxin Q/BCP